MSDSEQIQLDALARPDRVDFLLDTRSPALKYKLMRRDDDPFPKPVPGLGRMSRWSLRAVLAWLQRQQQRGGTWREDDGALNLQAAWQLIGPSPAVSGSGVPPFQSPSPSLGELRARYESGVSLDTLCGEFRIGKARLSRLVRESGATVRRPGRPARTA